MEELWINSKNTIALSNITDTPAGLSYFARTGSGLLNNKQSNYLMYLLDIEVDLNRLQKSQNTVSYICFLQKQARDWNARKDISWDSKGLFTWSGGPRSSGFGFFRFHSLGDTKQKKPTPLNRGPRLHVNRVLLFWYPYQTL